MNKMNEDLSKINLQPIYNCKNVSRALKLFYSTIKNVFNQHAPFTVKRVKGRKCLWLTSEIRRKMLDSDRLLCKVHKNKRTTDQDAYKRLVNECTNKVHNAKSRFYRNLLNDNTENPCKFWSAIKSIYLTKTLKSGSSNTTSNQHSEKVSIFSQYFKNAIKSLKQLSIPLVNFPWKYSERLGIRTIN